MRAPLPLACILALVSTGLAGTYTNNFDAVGTNNPNGAINVAINLGGGLLNGAAGNAQVISNKKDTNGTGTINVGIVKSPVGSGSATALRLAEKVTSSCLAALVCPVIDAGTTVSEFTVTLDLLLDKNGVAAVPADGFNISFGQALSGVGGAGGHLTAYGLIVNFDTYQNATTDPRSIEIFSDGVSVGNFLATGLPGGNFTYDQTFRSVVLHWDANGLDLTYAGQVIFNDLPVPGFQPLTGCNFVLNSATGGLFQDMFIDNLSITTVATPLPPVINTGGVVIEEIVADNAGGIEDEDLAQPDWLELYNGTASPANVTGWKLQFTGGTPAVTTTWTIPTLTIPAYGYQLIYASGKNRWTNVRPHTNFSLEKAGGTLSLLMPDGTTEVNSLVYAQQKEDIAYGRLGVAQSTGFLETPTPGARNDGRQAANFRPSDPVFDLPSQVISTTATLNISLPLDAPPGAEIRYTTNNVEPSETSPLYSSALAISTGVTVKARVFAAGYLPSRTGNRSFILLASGATNNVANNYNGSGQAFSSGLPVIVMDSYGKNVDALTLVTGLRPYRFTQAAIYDVNPGTGRASLASPPTDMLRSGTHVRGQSSSGQTERPYAWEIWQENEDTDRDVSILGYPAHSDWVLMTLTLDKSMMRNWLMQQLMLDANGSTAGVRCRFVEVFFNQNDTTLDYSDYRGVYLLMEKLSRTRERVNIAKINEAMSEPALINGGYIVKNDKTPYESSFTPASVAAIPGSSRVYDIYDPEPATTAQNAAIKTWFDQMTTALAAATYNDPLSSNYYGNWLDERSFIDKTLWLELCKEVDAYVFSYYFSKDRNGKLRAFPFWDVDRSLGNSNYGNSNAAQGFKWWHVGSNYTYYTRLDDDAEFNDRYWNRWVALRRSLFAKDAVFARIEATYTQLTEGSGTSITNTAAPTLQVPAARHYRKYAILGSNSFGGGMTGQVERTTWRQEVDAMKSWIAERLDWIDRMEPLRAPELLNAANSLPKYGGNVAAGYQFRLDNPNTGGGTVLYTVDGPDPRQTGGAQNPAALTATAGTVTATTVAASGRTWKWLLPTSAPAATWKDVAFDDSTWASGAAPLGYGETGLGTTLVGTAPNYTAANAEPTPAYFRSTFTASGVASLTGAVLEIQVDDGAVIYLNGQEWVRVNYPYAPTPPSFAQEASGPIDVGSNRADTETQFYQIPVDVTKLVNGTNTIAVEVHQAIYSFPPNGTFPNNTFSDLRFDCRIVGLTAASGAVVETLTTPGARIVRSRVKNGAVWSPLTEAIFVVEATPASAATLVVSELHYHPADPTPAEVALGFTSGNDFEYIELQNISAQALDLTGVRLEDAVAFDFTTAAPAARFLPPGGRVVVVENVAAFTSRLAPAATAMVAGAFIGNFSNNGETLTVRAAGGVVIKQFHYNDQEPWPVAADGAGYSLVLNNPPANPDHTLAASWHASAGLHGAPGADDHTPFPAGQIWDADTDGDGIADGLEYALGQGGANPPLPGATTELYTPPAGVADTYLLFRFQRNLSAGGVTYTPQLSTDLLAWNAAALTYVSTLQNADGTATVTYRSTQPAAALPNGVFLRLSVTR